MYTLSLPSGTLRLNGEIVPYNSPEYAAWLAAGNGPREVQDPEPEFPRIVVTPWQIRKALNAAGLRQAVEQAIEASGDMELADGWKYADEFVSDNDLALMMGAGLGKSRAEMQSLFELAASL